MDYTEYNAYVLMRFQEYFRMRLTNLALALDQVAYRALQNALEDAVEFERMKATIRRPE